MIPVGWASEGQFIGKGVSVLAIVTAGLLHVASYSADNYAGGGGGAYNGPRLQITERAYDLKKARDDDDIMMFIACFLTVVDGG